MTEIPLEKRFQVLCQIVRAQHFAWRQAVQELCPDVEPEEVVQRMWQITGRETARGYAAHLDPARPLAEAVAKSIAWSSRCMGEEAAVESGSQEGEAFVRHTDCPWYPWHDRLDLLPEDRRGCDAWFASTLGALEESTGKRLRFETLSTLPDGDASCLRRIWVED